MAEKAMAPVTVAVTPPAPLLVNTGKALLQRKCVCGESLGADDKCEECKKKDGLLQRRSFGGAEPPSVPPIVHEVLRSPGQPLDAGTRAFFEPRFGFDLSSVRVHTDARAADSAQAVNAAAYTVGQEIVFGKGQYSPASLPGRELLAHELTHVVQQRGLQPPPKLNVSPPDDRYERQAARVAAKVTGLPSSRGSMQHEGSPFRGISPFLETLPQETSLRRRRLSGLDEDAAEQQKNRKLGPPSSSWAGAFRGDFLTAPEQISRQTLPPNTTKIEPSFEEQAESLAGRAEEVEWSKKSPGLTEQSVPGKQFLLMNFAINGSKLKAEHEQFLIDALYYRTLTADPMASLRIIGHTDNTGPKEFNQKLALARARSVEAQMKSRVRKGGIEAVTGKGSEEPIADNGTPLGRARNRRVEVQVIPWKPVKPVAELLQEAQAGQKPFVYRVDNFAACPFKDTVKQIVEGAFRPIGIIQFDWDGKASHPDAVISFDDTMSFPMALGLTGTIYLRSFLENQICKDEKDPKTCENAFPQTADVMGKAIGNTVAHEAAHLLSLDHVAQRDNFMWSAELESLHGKKQTFDEKVLMRRTYHLLQVKFNDSQLVRMANRIAEKRKEAKAHPHEITFE